MLEATVVMARCQSSKKPFGITMEKRGGVWKGVWAFATREASAKKEGFDKETIKGGDIEIDKEYPGCPYCGNNDFCTCLCGKVFCDLSTGSMTECPHCGMKGVTCVGYSETIKSGAF